MRLNLEVDPGVNDGSLAYTHSPCLHEPRHRLPTRGIGGIRGVVLGLDDLVRELLDLSHKQHLNVFDRHVYASLSKRLVVGEAK